MFDQALAGVSASSNHRINAEKRLLSAALIQARFKTFIFGNGCHKFLFLVAVSPARRPESIFLLSNKCPSPPAVCDLAACYVCGGVPIVPCAMMSLSAPPHSTATQIRRQCPTLCQSDRGTPHPGRSAGNARRAVIFHRVDISILKRKKKVLVLYKRWILCSNRLCIYWFRVNIQVCSQKSVTFRFFSRWGGSEALPLKLIWFCVKNMVLVQEVFRPRLITPDLLWSSLTLK